MNGKKKKRIGLWKFFFIGLLVLLIILSSIWGITGRFLFATVTLYGGVVIVRSLLQIIFARLNNREMRRIVRTPIIEAFIKRHPEHAPAARYLLERLLQFDDFRTKLLATLDLNDEEARQEWYAIVEETWRGKPLPTVGIVVPIYKTPPHELRELVESIVNQTYANIARVWLVLNQPPEDNPEMVAFIHQLIAEYGPRFEYHVQPEKGKRNAMFEGFERSLAAMTYTGNSDSDSFDDPDAISNAVRVMESDENIACLTGDIRVSNPNVNLLTRLTYQRYYFAFNIERAAQSLFQDVTCMSGPFMMVRTSVLGVILPAWINQHFLGNLCNFGDDRHISTLCMKLGYGSVYSPESISYTDVPTSFWIWRPQQTRWSRSAARETIISIPWIWQHSLWVVLDVTYQFLFPFLLFVIFMALSYRTLSLTVTMGVGVALESLIPYAIVVLVLNLLFKSLYGYLVHRDAYYSLSPLYIVLHYFALLWIKMYAMFTLDYNEWGTK